MNNSKMLDELMNAVDVATPLIEIMNQQVDDLVAYGFSMLRLKPNGDIERVPHEELVNVGFVDLRKKSASEDEARPLRKLPSGES